MCVCMCCVYVCACLYGKVFLPMSVSGQESVSMLFSSMLICLLKRTGGQRRGSRDRQKKKKRGARRERGREKQRKGKGKGKGKGKRKGKRKRKGKGKGKGKGKRKGK